MSISITGSESFDLPSGRFDAISVERGLRTGLAAEPRTLLDIFDASAARWPERIALDAPDGSFDYSTLSSAAAELGARINRAGIGAGDYVAVQVPSGTSELYLAILGVLKSGAAYVPIDVDDPPERSQDILKRSGARALISAGLNLETTGLAQRSDRSMIEGVTAVVRERAETDDDAWVIFTSGSTGRPKGVAVTHRSAAAFVDAEAQLWRVLPEDRVLAGLSVGFDASCEEIWLAWRNGGALVPAPRDVVRAGEELGSWLIEQRITVVSTVPTLAAMWDESCLHEVRLLILGGEACPQPLGWRLSAGREVWNTYGPTEATVVSTAAPVLPGQPITIGRPLPGWLAAVVEDGEPVAPGEPGELVIGGVGLARYLDSELDRERYAPLAALGWERAYRSGDIVREGPGGFEFVGRRDDQVKIGGRRIELGEVESVLRQQPGVRAAAVAVRESAAQNKLLVGYVVVDDDLARDSLRLRAQIASRLPAGMVPLIAFLDELPVSSSGKVDRKALPWPINAGAEALAAGVGADGEAIGELERWVGEQWVAQLGPVPIAPQSDFFALGGTSLMAAKLTSAVRERFPALAVADLYHNPTLRTFSQRLEQLGEAKIKTSHVVSDTRPQASGFQLLSVFVLLLAMAPSWLFGILAIDRFYHTGLEAPWGVIIGGYLLLVSAPARAGLAVLIGKLVLPELAPGRYPRRGLTATRIIFVDRLCDAYGLRRMSSTPWALRWSRFAGKKVGDGARLGTMPPLASLVEIGAGATIEADVDIHGWWIEGSELVLDTVRIGAGARIGTRSTLAPGAVIGDGAEIEPGTVINGKVPARERWGGVPAVHLGRAGEAWPSVAPPEPSRREVRFWKLMFAAGLGIQTLIPLLASAPAVVLYLVLYPGNETNAQAASRMIMLSPLFAGTFVISFALLYAAASRLLGRWLKPGVQPGLGRTGWALWMSGDLAAEAITAIFPLYSSSFTRRWLRLCGIEVGRKTEISIANGVSTLTRFGETSFVADDVTFATAFARDGWLKVAPITVGSGTFLGNSAILGAGTTVGDDSLVGLMTVAPERSADGTSWLGSPALELPRHRKASDASRTINPPARLRAARRAMDVVRILLPGTVATIIGALSYLAVSAIGNRFGVVALVVSVPFVLFGAGVCAALFTVAVKWVLMGRYRPGDHPLYSFYVWCDEIVNSCQEQLAGPFLLASALGTPLMTIYLRLMGSKVGRDVWMDNLNTTEFDLTEFGDGAVVNRGAVIETHLFHDRVMSTGPSQIGAGVTVSPYSVILPDTKVGAETYVGPRSIVLRGEELPADSRWHGAPVVPA